MPPAGSGSKRRSLLSPLPWLKRPPRQQKIFCFLPRHRIRQWTFWPMPSLWKTKFQQLHLPYLSTYLEWCQMKLVELMKLVVWQVAGMMSYMFLRSWCGIPLYGIQRAIPSTFPSETCASIRAASWTTKEMGSWWKLSRCSWRFFFVRQKVFGKKGFQAFVSNGSCFLKRFRKVCRFWWKLQEQLYTCTVTTFVRTAGVFWNVTSAYEFYERTHLSS